MKSEVYDITNQLTRISFDDTLEVKRRWKGLGFYFYGINFGEQELTLASHGKSKQVTTVPYNDIVNIAFDVAEQRAGEGQGMSGAPWSTSLEIKILLNNGEKYGFYQYEVVETVLQLEQVLSQKKFLLVILKIYLIQHVQEKKLYKLLLIHKQNIPVSIFLKSNTD